MGWYYSAKWNINLRNNHLNATVIVNDEFRVVYHSHILPLFQMERSVNKE